MSAFVQAASKLDPNWLNTGIVTVAGMLIVFAVLVLFVFIIWLSGRAFSVAGSQKSPHKDAPKAPAAPKSPAVQKASVPKSAVAPKGTDDEGELLAVIAAAAYSYLGEDSQSRYQIRSIRPAAAAGALRGAWAQSGILDNTRPF